MNQSIWERRQAVASRLEGHAQQVQGVLAELTSTFAAASLRLEDVDPHGHLRAAVSAVAHAAPGRPGLDVVLGGGAGGHGVRVQVADDGSVALGVVTVTTGEPAPQAVASELASLLWNR
jgi:hypothetical protein